MSSTNPVIDARCPAQNERNQSDPYLPVSTLNTCFPREYFLAQLSLPC